MDALSDTFSARDPAPVEEGSSRADRRDQQVQRILDAAKTCFVRSGFQGASMHQICAEVGMSPGALYRYFPSKEAIVEAIAAADRKHDAAILARMLANPSVMEGLVDAFMAHLRHVHETGDAPMLAEISVEAMRNEAVRAACSACMMEVDGNLRGYLGAALARGEIAPVVRLDALVPMLLALGEGMAVNDLPSRGVPFEEIETAMRASLGAMLRPAGNAASTKS